MDKKSKAKTIIKEMKRSGKKGGKICNKREEE